MMTSVRRAAPSRSAAPIDRQIATTAEVGTNDECAEHAQDRQYDDAEHMGTADFAVATFARPDRPRLTQRKIGARAYTRPPMIKHVHRPGVAASRTLLAVTWTAGGWGC